MTLSDCFALFVKFFFLLTPPFVMSAFLSVTKDNTIQERNTLAIWITLWILIISGVLLFFGGFIFKIFGITLDAFRIGTGALLFLTAVSLVRGDSIRVPSGDSVQSLAVVPMAIPITLGPASIGVLMVYGGEIKTGLGFFLASFHQCSRDLRRCAAAGFKLHSESHRKERIGGPEQTYRLDSGGVVSPNDF